MSTNYKAQVIELEAAVNELRILLGALHFPTLLKDAIARQLADVQTAVNELKNYTPPPQITPPSTDIHLIELSVYPNHRDMEMDGVRKRLPPQELSIIIKLASNPGQPVKLDKTHSTLTRMSNLRKMFPRLKTLIKSMGKGAYILQATRK